MGQPGVPARNFFNDAMCRIIDSGTRKVGIRTIGNMVMRSLVRSTSIN